MNIHGTLRRVLSVRLQCHDGEILGANTLGDHDERPSADELVETRGRACEIRYDEIILIIVSQTLEHVNHL